MPQLIFGQPQRAAPFQAPFPRRQPEGNSAAQLLASMMQQQQPGANLQTQISGQLALESLRQAFERPGRDRKLDLLEKDFELREKSQFNNLQRQILEQGLSQSKDLASFQNRVDARNVRQDEAEALSRQAQLQAQIESNLSQSKARNIQRDFNDTVTELSDLNINLFRDITAYNNEKDDLFGLSDTAENSAGRIQRFALTLAQKISSGSPAQTAAAFQMGQELINELFPEGETGSPALFNSANVAQLRNALSSTTTREKISQYRRDFSDFEEQSNRDIALGNALALQAIQGRSAVTLPGQAETMEKLIEEIKRGQRSELKKEAGALDSFFDKAPDDETTQLLQSFLGTIQQ